MTAVVANDDAALNFLPERLRNALLPFQKRGVKYGLEKEGRLLIADEMGLGKTVQALCVAYKFKEDWPLLIVTPSSMRYPWIEEIEKWLPEIDPRRIRLVLSQGDINEISADRVDVVVVSYGLFSSARRPKDYKNFYRPPLVEAMFRADIKVVILDESHYVKNPNARRTENVVDIVKKAKRKILLSGTPALAKPAELFSQVDAILPGAFGTWQWYAKRYCNARYINYGKRKQWDTSGASNLEELQNKLTSRVMIRRLKADVLPQLPPKTRQRIPFEVTQSDYKKTIDGLWKELSDFMSNKNCTVANIISMVRNNTFSDGPEVDEDGEEKPKKKFYSEKHFIRSTIMELSHATGMAKVGSVIEYLRLLLQNSGEKFLVFAHHKAVVEGLAGELSRLSSEDSKGGGGEGGMGKFRYIRIDGGVPAELRMQLVRQFQTDPDTRVALLSIMAAGTGLTFTSGSHVVFAELHWTPGVLQQCEDRVHRIGQRRSVHIHYLVARDTIDEWLWAALSRKTQVVSLALNGVTQTLNPDVESNKEKLELLTKASTWMPPEEPQLEEGEEFFNQTCVPADQSFITDFFRIGPKSRDKPKKVKFWKRAEVSEETNRSDESKRDNGAGDDSIIASSSSIRGRRKRRRVELLATQGDLNEEEEEDFLSKSRDEKRRKALKKTNRSERKGEPGKKVGVTKKVLDDPFEMAELEAAEKRLEERERDEEAEDSEGEERNEDVAEKNLDPKEEINCNAAARDRAAANEAFQWSCKCCTFLNYSRLKSCEICDSPRVKTAKRRVGGEREGSSRAIDRKDDFSSDANVSTLGIDEIGTSFSQLASSTPAKKHLPPDPADLDLEPESEKRIDDEMKSEAKEYHLVEDYEEGESAEEKVSEELVGVDTRGRIGDDVIPRGESEAVDNHAITSNDDHVPDDMFDSWDEDDFGDEIPRESPPKQQQPRFVDLSKIPTHDSLFFFASRNTERIYVYDSSRRPLDVNFLPLDVETENWSALPDALLHPTHARLLRVFLRDWNSLTETKRRMIKKAGEIFLSPKALYEDMLRNRKHCVERKIDLAELNKAAEAKAAAVGGSTRVLIPNNFTTTTTTTTTTTMTTGKGDETDVKTTFSDSAPSTSASNFVQALDSEENPLCLFCQGPISNALSKTLSSRDDVAWHTRFCRRECREEYLVKRAQTTYIRQELLLAEKGVCQICGVAAHEFYVKMNEEKNLEKRSEMIKGSVFNQLRSFTKNRMVAKPSAGDFWQADHRLAVVEGGGQCDIGNFRTLCTVCHAQETKALMERVRRKKKLDIATSSAAGHADLRKFYKPI